MNRKHPLPAAPAFGGWEDAERLRRWAFRQRTPQQRLDWLIEALDIAYQRGALVTPPRDRP
jgi:hypothetical protein